MATDIIVFEGCDQLVGVKTVIAEGVVFVVLALDGSEGELYFPSFGYRG